MSAQLISDSYISKNYNVLNLKSSSANNSFKTVRVNIHFILRSDGTGNFGETSNILENVSSENSYWFADQVINYANN